MEAWQLQQHCIGCVESGVLGVEEFQQNEKTKTGFKMRRVNTTSSVVGYRFTVRKGKGVLVRLLGASYVHMIEGDYFDLHTTESGNITGIKICSKSTAQGRFERNRHLRLAEIRELSYA